MSWNTSLLSGPWPIPIYSADGTTITGYQSNLVFVLPVSEITEALQTYISVIPEGVPVLAGTDCIALIFSNEESAKEPLATYWENDL